MSFKPDYISLLKRCLTASIYDESAWTLIEGPMKDRSGALRNIKRAIVHALRKRGIILVRARPYNDDLREKGIDWPLFGFTMVGMKRLNNIQHCIETVLKENIPGDFVETGVWRGGSSIFAKALLKYHGDDTRTVWCCDSFEGMPVPTKRDLKIKHASDFSDRSFIMVDEHQVANNFRKFGLLDERVKFIKGWFCDSLPNAPIERIAVLRLDGDLYESTMDALKNLYDKVSIGGFIIVDDYYTWPGCRTAVDEFRLERRDKAPLDDIDTSAVYWRKE